MCKITPLQAARFRIAAAATGRMLAVMARPDDCGSRYPAPSENRPVVEAARYVIWTTFGAYRLDRHVCVYLDIDYDDSCRYYHISIWLKLIFSSDNIYVNLTLSYLILKIRNLIDKIDLRNGASIFKMRDQSRHKSLEVLAKYVRNQELFHAHGGGKFL